MKTILIVDDEGEMLAALAKMIERRGSAKVLTAVTPEEGITIYRENKPDAVFLDLHLSHITGIEVLQKLKEINPQVKAYFITGDQAFVDRHPPESVGAIGYLVKPIVPQELIKIIESV